MTEQTGDADWCPHGIHSAHLSILSEPKIDCHVHVLDPARFPYRADTPYRPAGAEIAPLETLLGMLELHGVRHALLVGTNSGYGEDLSPVLDALQRGEGRFKGVGVVSRDIGTAALASLKAQGIAGIAFNAAFHSPEYYAGTADLLSRMADMGMFLDLQVQDDQLLAFLPLIERSKVSLVIDHCGRPHPAKGLDQPGFQALLALGRAGRACVKLSGFNKLSAMMFPHPDALRFVQALIEAFTPQQCLWASDWPFLRAGERLDYTPILQQIATLLPDPGDRHAVFWETPRRIFGFGE